MWSHSCLLPVSSYFYSSPCSLSFSLTSFLSVFTVSHSSHHTLHPYAVCLRFFFLVFSLYATFFFTSWTPNYLSEQGGFISELQSCSILFPSFTLYNLAVTIHIITWFLSIAPTTLSSMRTKAMAGSPSLWIFNNTCQRRGTQYILSWTNEWTWWRDSVTICSTGGEHTSVRLLNKEG